MAKSAVALLAIAFGVAIAIAVVGAVTGPSVALSFKQSVRTAQFRISNARALEAGGGAQKVCWTVGLIGERRTRTWCAVRPRSGTGWALAGKKRGAKIRISDGQALLAIEPDVWGLVPGRYRWHLEVFGCGSRCPDRTPESGSKTVRIHGLIPARCKARGAAQIKRGPRRAKRIALTFDDGPAPLTPQFLDKLRRLNVKATFFVVGRQTQGKEALLMRMLREGHEIANHSWNHANLAAGGPAASRQLRMTNRAIKRASGFRPCLMRPPYGASSRNLVRRVRAQGMTSILWNVDPLDWRMPGTGPIAKTIAKKTRAGSVILEHDGGGPRGQTLAAIERYVRALRRRGYKFVTVSELLGYDVRYRVDRR